MAFVWVINNGRLVGSNKHTKSTHHFVLLFLTELYSLFRYECIWVHLIKLWIKIRLFFVFLFFGYLNSINSVNFEHTKATRLIAILLYSDKIVCCIHILTNHPKCYIIWLFENCRVHSIFSPASAIYNSANVNLCSDCRLSLFDYNGKGCGFKTTHKLRIWIWKTMHFLLKKVNQTYLTSVIYWAQIGAGAYLRVHCTLYVLHMAKALWFICDGSTIYSHS